MASRRLRLSALMRPERLVLVPAILLEVLWAYPWMVLFSHSEPLKLRGETPIGFGSSLAVLVAAYVFSRRVPSVGKSTGWVALLALLGTLFVMMVLILLENSGGEPYLSDAWVDYASSNPSIFIIGLVYGTFLIWRGFALGRTEVTFDHNYRMFVFGFLALAFLLVIWGISARGDFEPLGDDIGGYLAAFFFVALAGLALSNFSSLQGEARRMGQGGEGVRSQNVTLAIGFALALVLTGVLLASLLSLNFVDYLQEPLSTLGDWLLTAFLYGIVLPLAYLVGGIAWLIFLPIGLLVSEWDPPALPPPPQALVEQVESGEKAAGVPGWIITTGVAFLAAIVVLVVIYMLYRLLRKRRADRADAQDDDLSESLWSRERGWRDFLGALKAWFAWLKARFRRDVEVVPVAARGGWVDRRVLNVRELYRGLLWEGERAGCPKHDRETPYEYASRLEAWLPEQAFALRDLTDEYVGVRYGGEELSKDRERFLNQVWHTLRSAFRGNED